MKLLKQKYIILIFLSIFPILLFLKGCSEKASSQESKGAVNKISHNKEQHKCPIHIQLKTGHSSKIKTFALSPDGKSIVSGDIAGLVNLWDYNSGEISTSLGGFDSAVYSISISPDSQYAAAGFFDNSVVIWKLPEGEIINKYDNLGSQVSFSPEGRYIACGGIYQEIILYPFSSTNGALEMDDLSYTIVMQDSLSVSNHLAFSPDGRLLASADGERSAKVWDTATGAMLQNIDGLSGWTHSVCFSPCGSMLAAGGYSMKSSVKWQTLQDEDDDAKSAYEDDYYRQAWASDQSVMIWDLERKEEKCRFEEPYGSMSVSFSKDGKQLLSSGLDNSLLIWDIEKKKEIHNILLKDSHFIANALFTPDMKRVITVLDNNMLSVIDIESKEAVKTFHNNETSITSIAVTPDGSIAVAAKKDGSIDFWNLRDYSLIRNIKASRQPVNVVRISADGLYAASGGNDGILRVWEVSRGRLINEFRFGYPILSLQWHPQKEYIAAGGVSGRVVLWDMITNEVLWTTKNGSYVISTAFSPDGQKLLAGSYCRGEDSVKLLSTAEGKISHSYHSQGKPPWSLAYLMDGNSFAVSNGQRILFKNLQRDESYRELKYSDTPIWSFELNPQDSIAAAGTMQGEVILWDLSLPDSQEPFVYSLNNRFIGALAFSPASNKILAGGKNSSIHIINYDRKNNEDDNSSFAILQSIRDGEWISFSWEHGFSHSRNALKDLLYIELGNERLTPEDLNKMSVQDIQNALENIKD